MSTLHLVATPIGNLEDVTLRALRVLGEARLVLAEDTRRTRVLLDRHAVKARPLSLFAHNEEARLAKALATLDAGGDVALVSDGGTPLVSDPGARLVQAVIAAGHRVSPVPGASALTAALTVTGFADAPATFLGFLPRKAGPRERLLRTYADRPESLIVFESPRRLAATLGALAAALGNRPACVARELTKLHEEVVRGTLPELADRFADGARGEVTLVVAGAAPSAPEIDLDAEIRQRLRSGHASREIAAELAAQSGRPRREVYARVIQLREAGEPE